MYFNSFAEGSLPQPSPIPTESSQATLIENAAQSPALQDTPPAHVKVYSLREKYFSELDRQALGKWPWMLRRLGIVGKMSFTWCVDCMVSTPDCTESYLMYMDISTGAWEMVDRPGHGYGFIALATHVLKTSSILAAQIIRKALLDIAGGDTPSDLKWLGEPDEVYEYQTESGAPMFSVERYSMGLGSKRACGDQLFKPRLSSHLSNGTLRWLHNLPSGEIPLYGLEMLASNSNAPVILVQGEHNADYLRGRSFQRRDSVWPPAGAVVLGISGCDPDGTRTDLSLLPGRDIYIWAENGEPGQVFANNVQSRIWQEDPSSGIARVTIRYKQGGAAAQAVGDLASTEGWHWRDYEGHSIKGLDKLSVHVPELRRKSDPVVKDKVIDDFTVNSAGVWVHQYKDGKINKKWLSSPIHSLYLARNPESQDWGVVVTCLDPDGRWHTWCIPKSMLTADQTGVYKVLSSLGATIAPYANLRTELARYLLTVDPGKRALSVTKTGWHRNQFVLPDGDIINAGESDESIVLQTQDPMGGNFVKQKGTLRQWQRTVGMRCVGNSRLVLAIAAVLAGPVLYWLGEENGGFHFRGNSSIGKTTILYVACGIWGPLRKFMRLWRATANGLESIAASHNDLALVLDEMSQATSTEIGPAAYLLANGQGKLRATQTGDTKLNASWRLIFLSSGEIGLKEHIEAGGGQVMAGQETRLIDIEADVSKGFGIFDTLNGSNSGAELSLTLKSEADQCYGTVGRAWLAVLADPAKRDNVLAAIRADIELFAASVPTDAGGQVSRVARRFGLIAAVGEAGIKHGILPWPEGHAMTQAQACFHDWLVRRGGTSNLETSQAIEAPRRFLQLHGDSRFTPMGIEGIEPAADSDSRSRTINRAGFRRVACDGPEFLVFPDVFNREICGSLNKKLVITELLAQGYLVPSTNGKPYSTVRLPGVGTAKVYRIKATILGGEIEDEPSNG